MNDEAIRYPDSAVRLASAVHRFKVPGIINNPEQNISFAASFRTVGSNEKTKNAMRKADEERKNLLEGLRAKKVSHKRVVDDAQRYIPLIQQILISCKLQVETARMDKGLVFQWSSGIEIKEENGEIVTMYQSEALMYHLVMTVACEALGRAGLAADQTKKCEFAAASRDYAAAVGIFECLANDQLPRWIAKGSALNVDEELLPLECSQSVASAFCLLFAAYGQQMAIATVLSKPIVPNYSLMAKLCLGVHDQLNHFLDIMLKNLSVSMMDRIDQDFYALLSFQISSQKALSLYFQARAQWDKNSFGIAIALLNEASKGLQTDAALSKHITNNNNKSKAKKKGRGKKKENNATAVVYFYPSPRRVGGIADICKIGNDNNGFKKIHADLVDFRHHINVLLQSWESDNSTLYFENVPKTVQDEHNLQEGLLMNKSETYNLSDEGVDPLLLLLPEKKKKKGFFF